jgi:alkanesulfonate monooxygenase SsuD/methylene tetrahydromethanopterin reductase-like flavin-dependent oxidoreductase (luciferase family)
MIAGMIKASYPSTDFITQAGLEISPELHQYIATYEFTELDRAAELLPEGFVDAFAWAGTSEQVAQKVASVLDIGISRITILPHETANSSVEAIVTRFVKEVLPDALARVRG